MAHWIRLLKLTDTGIRRLRKDPSEMFGAMNQIVAQCGARIVTAFATLGNFDVVTIIEAPDEGIMEKMEELLDHQKLYTSQTLPAIQLGEFLKVISSNSNFGLFLETWLSAKAKYVTDESEKDKKRKRKRSEYLERSERAPLPQGLRSDVLLGFPAPLPAEITDLSFGSGDSPGGLGCVLSRDTAEELEIQDWQSGQTVRAFLSLHGEREKLPIEANVAHLTHLADGSVSVGLSFGVESRAVQARIERFMEKIHQES